MWFRKKKEEQPVVDSRTLHERITAWWTRWYYIVWTVAGVIVAISSIVTIMFYWRAEKDPADNPYTISNLMKEDSVIEERVKIRIWKTDMKKLYIQSETDDSEQKSKVLDQIDLIPPNIFPKESWKNYFAELKELLRNCIISNDLDRRFKFLWKWQRPPWGGVAPTCWRVSPIKIRVEISDDLMAPSTGSDPDPGIELKYYNCKKEFTKTYESDWALMKKGVLFPMAEIEPFWIDGDTKKITIEIWDYNWRNEKKGQVTVDLVAKPNGKEETDDYTIEWEFTVE